MLKKTLLRSFNVLKISTWIAAFIAFVLLVVVAFFILFSQTIKGSIEDRLSQVSGLDVNIEKIYLEGKEKERGGERRKGKRREEREKEREERVREKKRGRRKKKK